MTTLETAAPALPTRPLGPITRYCTTKANTPAPFTGDASLSRFRFEFVPAQFLGYIEQLPNGEIRDNRALVNNAFYRVWPESDSRWPEIYQERLFHAAFDIENELQGTTYAQ